MSSDSQFEIPEGFFPDNEKEEDSNEPNILNVAGRSFIDDLYMKNLSFSEYKPTKLNSRKTKKAQTQQQKRVTAIKNLVRLSNVKEKLVLDIMRENQNKKKSRQKNRIISRITKGKQLINEKDHFQHFQVVDLDQEQQQPKLKPILYIKRNRAHEDTNTKISSPLKQADSQVVQIKDLGQSLNIVPFGANQLGINHTCDISRPIYEKDAYRFNVLWWEKGKLTEDERKKQKFVTQTDVCEGKTLNPEVVKSLKRNLKPLRRHKLISTKYAPLAEFMPNREGTLPMDGIQNGKMIETSSQDDMELYEQYDKKLNEEINPTGAINLDESEGKKKRKSKKAKQKANEYLRKLKSGKKDGKTSEYTFENHEIGNKLKRALRKMNDEGWEEGKIYGKGLEEDNPIEL